jgi:hypothetical protein
LDSYVGLTYGEFTIDFMMFILGFLCGLIAFTALFIVAMAWERPLKRAGKWVETQVGAKVEFVSNMSDDERLEKLLADDDV